QFTNINAGNYGGDLSGDPLRTAFLKVNAGFAWVAAALSNASGPGSNSVIAVNVGSGLVAGTNYATNGVTISITNNDINGILDNGPATNEPLAFVATAAGHVLTNGTTGGANGQVL